MTVLEKNMGEININSHIKKMTKANIDNEAKNTKVKVLKVKFQNLGENGAECFFTWEPKSGSYIPQETMEISNEKMPWE